MFGGGGGDVLTALGAAADVLAAGGGAETLTAAGSSGNNSFFAGSGNDLLVGGGGASAMIAGPGDATLIGGSGYAIFGFVDGRGGGTDLISGFNPAFDEIDLVGYGSQAVASALGSAVVSGGSTVLTLTDSTRIIFAGVTNLNASSFLP
jgi:Ca2+-binding RTX toxin-like protein